MGQASNYDQIKDVTGTGTTSNGIAYNAERTTVWRHNGGANVCFFDGHVAWLGKNQIYNRAADGTFIGNDALWKVLQ